MIKKMVLGISLTLIFGLLILGGINRTIAKTVQNEPLDLANTTGPAAESEWLTTDGRVESVDDEVWVVRLSNGKNLELKERMIVFMTEQGFTVDVNDSLIMKGFLEGTSFEVGQIDNETSGQSITIRDQAGHPLWSGGRSGGK